MFSCVQDECCKFGKFAKNRLVFSLLSSSRVDELVFLNQIMQEVLMCASDLFE